MEEMEEWEAERRKQVNNDRAEKAQTALETAGYFTSATRARRDTQLQLVPMIFLDFLTDFLFLCDRLAIPVTIEDLKTACERAMTFREKEPTILNFRSHS